MRITATLLMTAGLLGTAIGVAARNPPADAPAGTTAQCKDGTWYDGAERKGACSGHKGIKTWYGPADAGKDAKKATAEKTTEKAKDTASGKTSDKAAAPTAAATATPPASPPTAPAAAPTAATAATAGKHTPPPNPATLTAKPGGGPGLVWVNESTKVYHCNGDRWYGKTKSGEYMAEADAKAKGFKGEHGKDCGK